MKLYDHIQSREEELHKPARQVKILSFAFIYLRVLEYMTMYLYKIHITNYIHPIWALPACNKVANSKVANMRSLVRVKWAIYEICMISNVLYLN